VHGGPAEQKNAQEAAAHFERMAASIPDTRTQLSLAAGN
jgi:hypothetical protein